MISILFCGILYLSVILFIQILIDRGHIISPNQFSCTLIPSHHQFTKFSCDLKDINSKRKFTDLCSDQRNGKVGYLDVIRTLVKACKSPNERSLTSGR